MTNNHGQDDYWVVKIDSIGTTKWQKTIGGSNSERPFSINTTNDGGIIVAGQGESADGDATINYGIVDYWVVKLNATVLPIQITQFDAQKNGADIILNWRTSTEEINTKFNIQRSKDGINYETIGIVYSNNNKSYLFLDKSIQTSKTIFYRLEIVENNGEKKYSDTRLLQINNPNINNSFNLCVYPNPTTGCFSATFSSVANQELVLKITDIATNKIVKTQCINAAKGINKHIVQLTNKQASSNYIVTLSGDNVEYAPVKLIIVH